MITTTTEVTVTLTELDLVIHDYDGSWRPRFIRITYHVEGRWIMEVGRNTRHSQRRYYYSLSSVPIDPQLVALAEQHRPYAQAVIDYAAERAPKPEGEPETVDLVGALRKSVEAAKARREAAERAGGAE